MQCGISNFKGAAKRLHQLPSEEKISLVLTDSLSCPTSRAIATGFGFQLMKGKKEFLDETLMGLSNEINGPGKLKDRLPPL